MKFSYRGKRFDIEGYSDTDHIFSAILRNSCFYEIDLLEYIFAIKNVLVEPSAIAIDVGANIGNHSIFLESFVSCHVISVEPNPSVIQILKRNLERNSSNYTLCEMGLSSCDSRGSIVLENGSINNIGMAKVKTRCDGDIQLTKLDSLVANWRKQNNSTARIGIIKIDVEGMEVSVLEGAASVLSKDKPELFVEAATAEEFELLSNFLNRFGYSVVSKWAATPVYHFSMDSKHELGLVSKKVRFLSFVNKLMRHIKRRLSDFTKAKVWL